MRSFLLRGLLAGVSVALMIRPAAAAPATASSHAALALGAIVGGDSPLLGSRAKAALARLFAGQTLPPADRGKIVVTAKAVTCVAGDVAVAYFNCSLAFGAKTVTLSGRAANELFATLIEAGVPSDGAAGKVYEGVHILSCTLDPAAIGQGDGSGADCSFEPGPA